MPAFLTKLLCCLVSLLSAVVGFFGPATELAVSSTVEYAQSFEQVQYDENRLIPQKDADGCWCFTTERALKVVQITDFHIGCGVTTKKNDKRAFNAVAAMLAYEKPDLVIFTGDMVYPIPVLGGTVNNGISTKAVIAFLETLGVYYTVTFGNHDSEVYTPCDREELSAMYADESLQYSLYTPGPENVSGCGNQIIKVKNSKGIVTNAFFVIDSNSYPEENLLGITWVYDNIHDDQIAWYKQSVLAIDAANKALDENAPMFTSACFFHIPLEEYGTAWNEYKANGYQNTENVTYIDGGLHETDEMSYCGANPDQMFETMLELGSTKAVFCGHDHKNNCIMSYKGINLVYGMSIDYLAYSDLYNKGAQRGCTVIQFSPDGSMDISLENYYQDKYVSQYEKETVSMDW